MPSAWTKRQRRPARMNMAPWFFLGDIRLVLQRFRSSRATKHKYIPMIGWPLRSQTMPAKPHLNLVFIGHVDHGKSTTVGRILYDTGNIDPHELENLKKLAEQMGKATFEFAFVMDQVKEERERGLTIDVAHKRFDTEKYYFTIIDAPGHRDFVKNMITGASQADAAILTCSAIEGPQAQTKEHIFLAKTLGIDQLVVAVNKMDAVNYAEDKFKETVEAVSKLTKLIGFKAEKVQFVPVAAFPGE